jgi:hypothetical protein
MNGLKKIKKNRFYLPKSKLVILFEFEDKGFVEGHDFQ